MSTVAFDNVWKVFNDGTVALRHLSLEINDGEFFVFLGPSGCGKTTLLRTVAGLDYPTEGRLLIDDIDVTDKPTKARNVAMVFQNFSLYPHMTVFDNMAFGIQSRKLKKPEINRRVRRAAALLDLEAFLNKRPHRLSGGQQQRVAMGRAIVRDPAVFLMDEPLSNLDARFRLQLRIEIARVQRQVGVTTLYVTHDQNEAMVLGDRVGVLRDGALQQVASPAGLYRAPDNLFVAAFIGSPPMNLAEATVEDAPDGLFVRFGGHRIRADGHGGPGAGMLRDYVWRQVVVGVRPEDLSDPRDIGAPADDRMRLIVNRRETVGPDTYLYFTVEAPLLLAEDPRLPAAEQPQRQTWLAEQPNEWMARLNHSAASEGDVVELSVRPGALYLFDPRTGHVVPH